MKYMLLIYNNQATYQSWTDEQRSEMFGDVDVLMKELTESGELVGGEALVDASNAVIVRVRDGVQTATDGPYAEAKEQLAGFFLIDTATRARAEEIAAQFAGPGSTVELRPAMWPGGSDE
jgi:hypothetical protein